MMRRRIVPMVCLAICCAALSACQHVAPYQREALARPGMDVKERELQRNQFYAHVYEAREGAMPSPEHAGGGCGCN